MSGAVAAGNIVSMTSSLLAETIGQIVASPAGLGVLGLLGGSFLGVVVTRGPARWGLVEGVDPDLAPGLARPRSRCPQCGVTLNGLELLPLLGFALRRGRCRACRAPISRLYPVLEAMGGVMGVALGLATLGWLDSLIVLTALLALLALATIDARTGFLPDALTLPLACLGLGLSLLSGGIAPGEAIAGLLAGAGAFWLVSAAYRVARGQDGLGGGDVKLMGAIGAFCGPAALPAIAFAAAAAALLVTIVGRRRSTGAGSLLRTEIRFGPYLAGAGGIAILARAMLSGGG